MGIYWCCLRANGLQMCPQYLHYRRCYSHLKLGRRTRTHPGRPALQWYLQIYSLRIPPVQTFLGLTQRTLHPTCVTMAPTGLMVCRVAQGACKSCASLSGPPSVCYAAEGVSMQAVVTSPIVAIARVLYEKKDSKWMKLLYVYQTSFTVAGSGNDSLCWERSFSILWVHVSFGSSWRLAL